LLKFREAAEQNEEVFVQKYEFKPLEEKNSLKQPLYPELLALRNET
jgi:hypothetical protein